jgi:hypothetical protein
MTSLQTIARQLVDDCVDRGEFAGYADHELDAKVDELAADLVQTWLDAHEQMLRDEPTHEDRLAWAGEQRRDLERGS